MVEHTPQIIPEIKGRSFIPEVLKPVNYDEIKPGDIIYIKRPILHGEDSLGGDVRGFNYKFCPCRVEEKEGRIFLVVLRGGTPSFPPGYGLGLEAGTQLPLDNIDSADLYKKED